MSDFIVKESPKHEPLPVGSYMGKFEGIGEVALPSGEKKWRFSWTVTAGAMLGRQASALSDREVKTTTLPGRLISGMLGRELVSGEDLDGAIKGLVGKVFLVVVQVGPKGGKPMVRMASAMPS